MTSFFSSFRLGTLLFDITLARPVAPAWVEAGAPVHPAASRFSSHSPAGVCVRCV